MNAAAFSPAQGAPQNLAQSQHASYDIYLHSSRGALSVPETMAGFGRVFESPEMAGLLKISDHAVADRLAGFFKDLSAVSGELTIANLFRVAEVVSVAEGARRGSDGDTSDFELHASRGGVMLRFGDGPRAFMTFQTGISENGLIVHSPSVGISGGSASVGLLAETICERACWSGRIREGLEPAQAVQLLVEGERESRSNFLG